jgi:hypothetical protein
MTLPLFLHPTKNVVDSMTQVQLAALFGHALYRVIPNKDAGTGAKSLDTMTSGASSATPPRRDPLKFYRAPAPFLRN